MTRAIRIDRRLSAIALAAVLGLSACDSVEDRVDRHYDRAVALLGEGERERARIEFRNALRLNENHVGSRFNIGRFFEEDGDLRAAVANYNLVAELDAEHLEARRRLAQIYLAGGVQDEAEQFLAEALALAPDDADLLATRAALLLASGDPAAAIDAANAALALDPESVSANALVVAAMIAQDRPSAALEFVEKLLERAPNEPAFNLQRLRLLGQLNDLDGVKGQLRLMAERFPDEIQFRRALVQLHIELREFDAAEAELRGIVEQTDSVESRIDLLRFVIAARGLDEGRDLLDRFVAEATSREQALDLRFAKAELEARLGDMATARETLTDLAADHAGSVDGDRAQLMLARFDMQGGDVSAARQRVDQVLARDSDNVEALALSASLHLDALEAGTAIEQLRRALNLESQNVNLLMLEARAQELSGNPSLVSERLGSALRFSNHAPDVALAFARHLRGRNQNSAAETVLAEAARRNPGSRDVLAALAQLRLSTGNIEGAEQVAAQLRDIEGGAVMADRVVASAMQQSGRVDETIDILQRMVADEATADTALGGLVTAYVNAGETDRARTLLDDILADNPANVRAQILRAELSLFERDTPAAEARLAALREIAPEVPASYLAYARYLAQAGRREAAEAVVREGIDAVAAPQSLQLSLAELLEARGAFDEAIEQYRLLFASNPDSMIVANNLASLLAEYHYQDPEALAFARRVALRLRSSTVPHFQDTFGWIEFLSGELDGALRSLLPAAEALPNNPIVRYHAGRVFAALNRHAEAREHLEAALAIDPNFPKADSARATLAAIPESEG